MPTTTTTYHLYASDGFESAHWSSARAETLARRGSKRRPGVEYSVVATTGGYTGGGHGVLISAWRRGECVAR